MGLRSHLVLVDGFLLFRLDAEVLKCLLLGTVIKDGHQGRQIDPKRHPLMVTCAADEHLVILACAIYVSQPLTPPKSV